MIVLPLIIFRMSEGTISKNGEREKENTTEKQNTKKLVTANRIAIWIQNDIHMFGCRLMLLSFVILFVVVALIDGFVYFGACFCPFCRSRQVTGERATVKLHSHAHTWLIYCLSQLNAQTCHTMHQNAAHRGIYFHFAITFLSTHCTHCNMRTPPLFHLFKSFNIQPIHSIASIWHFHTVATFVLHCALFLFFEFNIGSARTLFFFLSSVVRSFVLIDRS